MDEVSKMPNGVYKDPKDNDLLHTPDGKRLPDGVYELDDGSVLLYEGNFEEAAKDGFVSA